MSEDANEDASSYEVELVEASKARQKEKRRSSITLGFESPNRTRKEPDSAKNMQPSCKTCQKKDLEHYTCAECDKQFLSKLAFIAHFRKHKHPPAICPMCSKEFDINHKLQRHMIKHFNERQFACEVCQKSYKRYSTLIAHKTIHEPKRFVCERCMKSFTQKVQLEVHMRRHSGIKPYKCDVCPKEFAQKTSLNNHKLTHTGIKPHRCEQCKEWFRQISNLNQHIQQHHMGGENKKRKMKRNESKESSKTPKRNTKKIIPRICQDESKESSETPKRNTKKIIPRICQDESKESRETPKRNTKKIIPRICQDESKESSETPKRNTKKNITKICQNESEPSNKTKKKRPSIYLAWLSCKKCNKTLAGSDNISKHKKMCL